MLRHKNVRCILSAAHITYTQHMTVRDAVAYRMHVAAALANGNWNGTMFGIMSGTRINNSERSISVPGHVPGHDGDVARIPMYGTSNSKQLLAPGMH